MTSSMMCEDADLTNTFQVANDTVSHPVENYTGYSDIREP
jgi:hypothetical protein